MKINFGMNRSTPTGYSVIIRDSRNKIGMIAVDRHPFCCKAAVNGVEVLLTGEALVSVYSAKEAVRKHLTSTPLSTTGG